MFGLRNKVAVVVGGAGYLGSAVCKGLVQQGACVIVADLEKDRLEQVTDALNSQDTELQCCSVVVDLTNEDSVKQTIEQISRDFKRLDIVVNATYFPHGKQSDEIAESDFSFSLRGNVTASFILAREAKKIMVRGGSIIMFSSMYGRVAPDPRIYVQPMNPNPIEYGVAKAGIEQMIRHLAVAWAADGIRMNGVAPGAFPHREVQEAHPDFIERLSRKIPLGRIGNQDEVTGAVVFLASEAASYITGQILVVDGGWTIW